MSLHLLTNDLFQKCYQNISKGTTLKLYWRNMAGWLILLLAWDNVSCSPDWPMQPKMPELLTLLLGLQMWTTTPYLRPEHLELKFGCKTNLLNCFSLLFSLLSSFQPTTRHNQSPEWQYLYMNELRLVILHVIIFLLNPASSYKITLSSNRRNTQPSWPAQRGQGEHWLHSYNVYGDISEPVLWNKAFWTALYHGLQV